MTLQERLEKLTRDNEQKKQEKNRLQGRLDGLMQQMKDEFGCDTIDELEDKVSELVPQISELERAIELQLAEMEAYANQ